MAILFALFGLLFIMNPIGGALGLTLLLAIFFAVRGIVRLVQANRSDGRKKTWMIASGVIALLLGVSILASWPWSGLWVIGIFLGVELILTGAGFLWLVAADSEADRLVE